MQRQRSAAFRRVLRAGAGLLTLALLCALLLAPPAVAASSASAVVRAGYFYNGDFMHKSDDGTYAGYDVEYYYTIAGYADWRVQFVEFDSLKAALAAMERGEIDVMSGLSKTDERVSRYLVSGQKMCTAHIAVQTRADDDRFTAGDTATMADLNCGILRGSNVVALYTDCCRQNGLVPHITEYDSLDLRNQALAGGAVDAIAGGSTIPGAQKIAEFPSLDLYFMFNRGRSDLKAQLDRAMSILSLEDPTYDETLFSEYFPSSRSTVPSFSAEEKQYIARHPVLRAAVLEDDAPFSSVAADGTAAGILPDYYAHLGKVMGLRFAFVPCASPQLAADALAKGQADLIGKAENNVFLANQQGMLLSVPYLKMNLVQITRAGTAAVSSAAVPACNSALAAELIAALSPSTRMTVLDNGKACFDRLKSGRTDAVICPQPAAAWLLNRNRASDYVVSSFGSRSWDTVCALPYGADGNTLRSILNKSIAVDGGYINQLLTSSALEDSADLAGIFDRLPVSVIASLAAAALILLVIAAAALVILIRRRRTERQLAARQAALAAAEEMNRTRHAFFGAVSHDMRTPLNGILGFANLALESGDPARVRDCLLKIRTSGNMLSALVNDTLIMSRMENGKYTLKPVPCGTTELLGEVLAPIRELAAEKGVRFIDNAGQIRPRRVLADRISLQKIVLNLLTNAVKFTPKGGTVTLNCRLDPAEGVQLESILRVSDTGTGISQEFLPHIFEPFAQENSANTDSTGSGMGLSIVKNIVDAMGGSISVTSEKGRGTTFTVRLHLEELAPESAAAPPPETDALCLHGRRVLVCEDNPLNLEILCSLLNHDGMETVCAENGRRGLELFAASAPGFFDAVLLDLRMPVMDGLDAARAIRALSRSDASAVPILAVSADAYAENVQECLDAGMDGHISKPVDAAVLTDTLAALIRGGRPGRAGT